MKKGRNRQQGIMTDDSQKSNPDAVNDNNSEGCLLNGAGGLLDRYGNGLFEDCIIYAKVEDGNWHFFSVWTKEDGIIDMYSCTYGYVHNLNQASISQCVLIGSNDEFGFTQNCD